MKKNDGDKHNSNFMHDEQNIDDDILFLACKTQEVIAGNIWYLDSGCSNHMTGNKNIFAFLDDSFQSAVKIGDDKRLQVKGKGDILVQTKKGVRRITDVFYVPGLKHNLLSVGQLLQKGHNVVFKDDVCEIKGRDGVLVAKVKMTPNKMFLLNFSYSQSSRFSTLVKDVSWLWHFRYGHLSFGSLSYMCQNHMVRGMVNISQRDHEVCEACILGKHHRN